MWSFPPSVRVRAPRRMAGRMTSEDANGLIRFGHNEFTESEWREVLKHNSEWRKYVTTCLRYIGWSETRIQTGLARDPFQAQSEIEPELGRLFSKIAASGIDYPSGLDLELVSEIAEAVGIPADRANRRDFTFAELARAASVSAIRARQQARFAATKSPPNDPPSTFTARKLKECGGISDTSFGDIVKASDLPPTKQGGGGAQRKFSVPDVCYLIAVAPKACPNCGPKAASKWRALVGLD